jgi:1-acylglycerone phosphate reductase
MRAVLITGCSLGGIGSSLATTFHAQSYHVFATARSLSKMSHLSSLPHTTFLTLEVTSPTSIQAALAAVEASGHRLEVLVNNAGIAPVMPLLDVELASAREVFETNVWGGLALVQAFREVLVREGGLVVNVGSLNAMALPAWMGMCFSV